MDLFQNNISFSITDRVFYNLHFIFRYKFVFLVGKIIFGPLTITKPKHVSLYFIN